MVFSQHNWHIQKKFINIYGNSFGPVELYHCNVFRICCRMNNIKQRKYMSLPMKRQMSSLQAKLLAISNGSGGERNECSLNTGCKKVTNVLAAIFNPWQQCQSNRWISHQSIKFNFWTNKPRLQSSHFILTD